MSSKGSKSIKPRYLSHSQPTRSNHIQSIVCRNKSTPISKKNVKLFFLFLVTLCRGDTCLTQMKRWLKSSLGLELEWSTLLIKSLLVPQDSLVKKVTNHAGINDSKFKITISSSLLTKHIKRLHA